MNAIHVDKSNYQFFMNNLLDHGWSQRRMKMYIFRKIRAIASALFSRNAAIFQITASERMKRQYEI